MADLLTGLTDDDITTRAAQGARMEADADATDAPATEGTDTTDQGDAPDTDADSADAPGTDSDSADAPGTDSDSADTADVDGTDA